MRTTKSLLVVLAMLVGACAADTDTTSTSDLLAEVDEATVTNQVLYVHDVSPVPLTAADLASFGVDTADAIPVRVEIFEGVAVAWFAPEGEGIIDRDFIVGLWDVVDRSTPTAGETAPADPAPTNAPTGMVVGTYTVARVLGEETEVGELRTAAEVALIDWFNRAGTVDELRLMRLLVEHHPGC